MYRNPTQRILIALFVAASAPNLARAHQPDRENLPVRQRIDLIGPIGNRLPPGHRRKFNRPTNWQGWIAYRIAPTSPEAMSWHRAQHAGAYNDPKRRSRIEYHYFYPKPWEAMQIGQRPTATIQPQRDDSSDAYIPSPLTIEDEEMVEPLSPPAPTPTEEPQSDSEELALPPVKGSDA